MYDRQTCDDEKLPISNGFVHGSSGRRRPFGGIRGVGDGAIFLLFLYQTYAEKLEQGVASSMIFRFFRLLFFLAWPNFEQLKQNSRLDSLSSRNGKGF